MSYKELGKSQLNRKKKINRFQHQDDTNVGILQQEFKAAIIKMFQQTTALTREANGKLDSLSKEIEDIKRTKCKF